MPLAAPPATAELWISSQHRRIPTAVICGVLLVLEHWSLPRLQAKVKKLEEEERDAQDAISAALQAARAKKAEVQILQERYNSKARTGFPTTLNLRTGCSQPVLSTTD